MQKLTHPALLWGTEACDEHAKQIHAMYAHVSLIDNHKFCGELCMVLECDSPAATRLLMATPLPAQSPAAMLGAAGGKATSEAKTAANRINARKPRNKQKDCGSHKAV